MVESLQVRLHRAHSMWHHLFRSANKLVNCHSMALNCVLDRRRRKKNSPHGNVMSKLVTFSKHNIHIFECTYCRSYTNNEKGYGFLLKIRTPNTQPHTTAFVPLMPYCRLSSHSTPHLSLASHHLGVTR